MTFERVEQIAGAFLVAGALTAIGVYALRSGNDTIHLGVGVVCIILALATIVPVQLKAGAKNLKDVSVDLHGATVVVMPAVEDALRGGDRHTDPPAGGA